MPARNGRRAASWKRWTPIPASLSGVSTPRRRPIEPGGKTWSGDSWKYGGGSVWNTPAIDPKNNLILFATGNPNPDLDGTSRKGDNAYTVSIVAIDSRNGKLSWWYQQVPHDIWDYDACAPVVLFDTIDENGKVVPAAAEAGKVGSLFIVNRLTGKLIRKSEPFVTVNENFMKPLTNTPMSILPGSKGGAMWSPPAYSPQTKYFYTMGINEVHDFCDQPGRCPRSTSPARRSSASTAAATWR